MPTPLIWRLFELAAAVCLCGQPFFLAVIWHPAASRVQGPDVGSGTLARRIRTAMLLAAAVMAVAAVVSWLPVSGGATIGAAASRFSNWRLAWTAVIIACRPWRARPGLGAIVAGISGVALLTTFSLTGHAAPLFPTDPMPAVASALHLVATAIWFGGLTCFPLLPWARLRGPGRAVLAAVVERFSQVGLLTMITLAASGLLLADRYMYGVRALTEHPYGLTLFTKLAFVVTVLGLAAVNHVVVRPRLAASSGPARPAQRDAKRGGGPARLLIRLVFGEIGLGLIVLALAVRLAATAPPPGEPVRLTATITHEPTATLLLEVPPLSPVRLTVMNPDGPPAGLYIPSVPGATAAAGRAGDLQVMVAPGKATTVTFRAPSAGQYVVYYVGREGLRPIGWLVVSPSSR